MSTSTPFDPLKRLLLVGHVFVDAHVESRLVRLGGIFHAARAAHAIGAAYSVAYLTPDYLSADVSAFLSKPGCGSSRQVGKATGSRVAPSNRRLGGGGDMEYDDRLRDSRRTHWDSEGLREVVKDLRPTDILAFAADYPLHDVIDIGRSVGATIHIDGEHDETGVRSCGATSVETLFLSTSSPAFVGLGRGHRSALRSLRKLRTYSHIEGKPRRFSGTAC